jgi:isoleucyl-tRNA synthetase
MAYKTLHYVLVRLSYVLAPFTPFLAEELYQKLTGGESVHLQDWLPAGHVNELEISRMRAVREVINEGLSQRAAAGIKVRQPLSSITLETNDQASLDPFKEMICEELNVKEVIFNITATPKTAHLKLNTYPATIDISLTPELKREGLMREVIRNVQTARKAAGLNVDDRIELVLETGDDELAEAIKEHADVIKAETLATNLTAEGDKSYSADVKVEGKSLAVKLAKV